MATESFLNSFSMDLALEASEGATSLSIRDGRKERGQRTPFDSSSSTDGLFSNSDWIWEVSGNLKYPTVSFFISLSRARAVATREGAISGSMCGVAMKESTGSFNGFEGGFEKRDSF